MSSGQSISAFLPADKVTGERLRQQVRLFQQQPMLAEILDAMPNPVVVLNGERQIVMANDTMVELTGVGDSSGLFGQRPGDVLQCLRAAESDLGCGTTEFCRTCGAARSIQQALHGMKNVQECRILQVGDGHGSRALDLRVWSTPIVIDGDSYTIFAVADTRDENRRMAMERIFFHDVLNTANVLYGFAMLLREEAHGVEPSILDTLYDASRQLIDEIQAQRQLTAAERGDLEMTPERLASDLVVREVIQAYGRIPQAEKRAIVPAAEIEHVELTSDPTLLQRVLGNLVKNALEASEPGCTVMVGAERWEQGVRFWVHNESAMSDEVQMQVFQRSFSTKGRNRGLGTYSVKLLGEQYLGGRVTFASSSAAGTTFFLWLPLEPPAAA